MPDVRAPQPLDALEARPGWRRLLWLSPLVLAGVFALLVVSWAASMDADEREAFRRMLEADADSVEAQLLARQDVERARLREVAGRLALLDPAAPIDMAAIPEAALGLRRLWNRLVWLDADQQVLARTERRGSGGAEQSPEILIRSRGLAQHLRVDAPGLGAGPGGQLLARYEFADLLGTTDWAWLKRRYEVDFVSELGEVIASTAGPAGLSGPPALARRLAGAGDVSVVLRPFEAPLPWWRHAQTVLLLGGLLGLGGAGSWLLRGQMARVQRAVSSARQEAAWRQAMEDSALVGLRARDLDGRILHVNRTLCDMVGYAPQELVGLKPPLPFWPADAIDAMMARNLDTLSGGAPASGYETRWLHRDGHPVDVMIFESRLFDPEGRHIGWMGSIVDISLRKQLEEREHRHLEQIAHHARLNDLGLLASELAHELNQPLTATVSYSAGLLKWIRTHAAGEHDLVEAAEQVQQQARRAGDIVHWIRRQTQRKDPRRTPEDLNGLVQGICRLRAPAMQRQGVALEWTLECALPPVPIERVAIEQVLTNLLRNAADALADHAGGRRVEVRTGLGADGAWVEVADSGPGVQGRSLDALCAPFFSTKDKASAMGLGLGICREIVEAHGGALSLSPGLGGSGARFRFNLPVGHAADTVRPREETVQP